MKKTIVILLSLAATALGGYGEFRDGILGGMIYYRLERHEPTPAQLEDQVRGWSGHWHSAADEKDYRDGFVMGVKYAAFEIRRAPCCR